MMVTVPNKPKTPLRSVRITDELWEATQKSAAAEGRTVSEVVRQALERYNAEQGKK